MFFSEIDKKIDYMTNLRKDKWVVEGELRKWVYIHTYTHLDILCFIENSESSHSCFLRLRNIHVKMTGRRDGSRIFGGPTVRNKCKMREGDSEEEEDDEDDSDDQGDNHDEEEEESWGKKEKKTVTHEEEVSSWLHLYFLW